MMPTAFQIVSPASALVVAGAGAFAQTVFAAEPHFLATHLQATEHVLTRLVTHDPLQCRALGLSRQAVLIHEISRTAGDAEAWGAMIRLAAALKRVENHPVLCGAREALLSDVEQGNTFVDGELVSERRVEMIPNPVLPSSIDIPSAKLFSDISTEWVEPAYIDLLGINPTQPTECILTDASKIFLDPSLGLSQRILALHVWYGLGGDAEPVVLNLLDLVANPQTDSGLVSLGFQVLGNLIYREEIPWSLNYAEKFPSVLDKARMSGLPDWQMIALIEHFAGVLDRHARGWTDQKKMGRGQFDHFVLPLLNMALDSCGSQAVRTFAFCYGAWGLERFTWRGDAVVFETLKDIVREDEDKKTVFAMVQTYAAADRYLFAGAPRPRARKIEILELSNDRLRVGFQTTLNPLSLAEILWLRKRLEDERALSAVQQHVVRRRRAHPQPFRLSIFGHLLMRLRRVFP